LRHETTDGFWKAYDRLPADVRKSADKAFSHLRNDASHPSLRFKPVGSYWSIRLGGGYRAMALKDADVLTWFWIGPHDEYMRRIKAG
jgi:hypothetical protein